MTPFSFCASGSCGEGRLFASSRTACYAEWKTKRLKTFLLCLCSRVKFSFYALL